MDGWILRARYAGKLRSHIEIYYGDKTSVIYLELYARLLFRYSNISQATDGNARNIEISEWIKEQHLSFDPLQWDKEIKVLFELTFG